MKTEFLKELLGDVPEDKQKAAIDAIMAENGKDVKVVKDEQKTLEAERDNAKEQLKASEETIKKLEGMKPEEQKVEIDSLKQQLKDKDAELETTKTAHAEEKANLAFNSVLEKALADAKAKDPADIKTHLDIEALKASQDQTADIEAAIKGVKEKKAYLFDESKPKDKTPSRISTGGEHKEGGEGSQKEAESLVGAIAEHYEADKGD